LKNLIRKLIPIALSIAVILPVSSAFAAEGDKWDDCVSITVGCPRGGTTINGYVVTDHQEGTILLRSVTNVYAEIGDKEPIGALAPQLVNWTIKDTKSNTWGTWYKVETWLGKETWVYAIRPIEDYVNVQGKGEKISIVDWRTVPWAAYTGRNNCTLYADAFQDTAITWASLAPQDNIEVVAKGNGMFQIKTWIGLYWVGMTPPAPKV
jgi:hypothetical protein